MNIQTLRHSLAHILAAAIQELYPGVRLGIGPATEKGFYYDFDFVKILSSELKTQKLKTKSFTPELPLIEKKMQEIIGQNVQFEKKLISKAEAKKLFKDQPYKLELIEEMPERKVAIYKSGKFIDLCRGPHIKSTKQIPSEAFKLTKIAGAYWRGSEKNPMLTRIYGVAFESKKELEEFLEKEKRAEERDHRVLGQKLELFIIDAEVGQGLPLWLPKGAILRHIIEDYLYQKMKKEGYQWLMTPHIANLKLWQRSGHWNFYRENMYSPIEIDKEKYLLKPMNCPFHVKIYNSKIRSYKDLPLRFAELGTVYRYERSGVLHGLTRVRGFTQDDAHIWCTLEQLGEELERVLKLALEILKTFGFENFVIYLSTRPEKYIGSEKIWEKSQRALKYALKKANLNYQEDPGGGVFYGPKIDIKIKDSLERPWQCTTIQVDFNLPQRFKIFYIDKKGKKKEPIMIHRALLGSLERFIGVLIENYQGALPLWLSPEQIWIIPVGKRHKDYAQKITKEFQSLNFRVKVRGENLTVSKKIREGEIQKIPYLLVVGDKEIKSKSVRVREREKGDIGQMKLKKFLEKIKREKKKRK